MEWRFTLSNSNYGDLVLSDEPIGWSEIALNIKRDMKWHGVFFEYAVALQFYGEGYSYLKTAYNAKGINEYIEIWVDVKCDGDADFERFFTGKLLLAKLVFDCTDNCLASCPIEQAGCLMGFKNRIDQDVDINSNKDFDGNALDVYSKLPFYLEMLPKSIILRGVANQLNTDYDALNEQYSITQVISAGIGTQTKTGAGYLTLPIHNITLNEIGLSEATANISDTPGGVPVILTAEKSGLFNFDVVIERIDMSISALTVAAQAICSDIAPLLVNADFVIVVNNVVVFSDVFYADFTCNGEYKFILNSAIHWNVDQYLSLGDEVKIGVIITCSGDWHMDAFVTRDLKFVFNSNNSYISAQNPGYEGRVATSINIKETILTDPTITSAFAINETISRVVEAITDNCMKAKSDYFGRTDSQPYASNEDGCGSLEILTKGLLLRQFPIENTVMGISFQDLFDSLNAIHNLGFGIEPDADRPTYDRIRVEPMEYFYDSSVILTCDNVPNITKRVMAEWYPSTIEIGYAKWETENSMGLDEFATKRNYRSTLKEIKNNVSKVCKFIASGYSIEVTRNIEYSLDSTKDWRLDNEIFIVCVRRGEAGALVVEQGIDCADTVNMTDIIDPDTVYNYRISPIRNLMRWTKAFMAAYFNDINGADAKFIFTNGNGNFIAAGELINGCFEEAAKIAENADINIAAFDTAGDGAPIYKNELDDFEYPLSLSDYNLIKANPRGIIEYRENSSVAFRQGYVYSIQYKPNDGKTIFTLLPKY